MQIANCTDESVEYTVDDPFDRTRLKKRKNRKDSRLKRSRIVRVFKPGANIEDDNRQINSRRALLIILKNGSRFIITEVS